MQKRLAIATFGLLTLVITGCGPGSEVEVSPTDAKLLSVAEYGALMAECLVGKGWDANSDPVAGVTAVFPESDGEQFNADFSACTAQVGLADPIVLSERQWTDLYVDYVAAITCLEALGIDMPEPVREDRFRSDGLGSHFAYQGLPQEYLPQLADLEAACPQPEVR